MTAVVPVVAFGVPGLLIRVPAALHCEDEIGVAHVEGVVPLMVSKMVTGAAIAGTAAAIAKPNATAKNRMEGASL